ncbi:MULTISPECIES: AbrB/MazE/SpoVT family DNA-binding domain-containing protein [Pseudomonas]|jgi:antitoxin ChpS|nr:AbrB/MazE/SpoVT family DNA-binding domain-containing protein [Pseudomonas sp. HN2-3]UDU81231.1 AbrB/MazE/SpoVT family DNA-binding domain-containing protein [Pseudomonas sp. HN2-3]
MMSVVGRPQVNRTTVKCQDPKDGTGDLIIDIPDEMLQAVGVGVGDELSIEVVDGVIRLRPLRSATPGPEV